MFCNAAAETTAFKTWQYLLAAAVHVDVTSAARAMACAGEGEVGSEVQHYYAGHLFIAEEQVLI